MKKKLSILLLVCLVLPIFALFGCEEVSSFAVYVYSSSTIFGSVSGTGSYDEGSTVTLTATAKQGSHFVAWIYQNELQLESGNAYKIENTLNSEEKAQKSTLTFSINASNQGVYTAVFDDSKMMYAKFDSLRLSTQSDSEEEEDNILKTTIMTASASVSQGTTEVFSTEDVDIKENVAIRPEKVDKVLKLSNSTAQTVRISMQFNHNNKLANIAFRADLKFQESTAKDDEGNYEEISGNKFTYHVEYADETYKIVFKFALDGQTYYLIANYVNL